MMFRQASAVADYTGDLVLRSSFKCAGAESVVLAHGTGRLAKNTLRHWKPAAVFAFYVVQSLESAIADIKNGLLVLL